MRFLVDAQLPPRLCRWLEARGCQALHVFDLESGLTTPDSEIWGLAKSTNQVVLSKDNDFFERATVLGKPPQVVHVDVGNCSNRVLFQILELNWSSLLTALEDGVPLISVTRTGLLLFERL